MDRKTIVNRIESLCATLESTFKAMGDNETLTAYLAGNKAMASSVILMLLEENED
jgi:hypothetical protein